MNEEIKQLIIQSIGQTAESKFVSFENKIRSQGVNVTSNNNIHTLNVSSSSSTPTTKKIGDLFEAFCMLYLQFKGYECYLLKDVSSELLTRLNLQRHDVGIDLIAIRDGQYYPVQCKFRSPSKDKLGHIRHTLGWKELSTFLSICTRTGGTQGWNKHIVMTNAKNVRWQGHRDAKDLTIARQSFISDFDAFQQHLHSRFAAPLQTQNVKNEIQGDSRETIRLLRSHWLESLSEKKVKQ